MTNSLATETEAPLISVVIPTRGEGGNLSRCVESVLENDYPSDRIEVIIVDGGGDIAPNFVDRWRGKCTRICVLANPRGITPVGMNLGIREAKGAYVLVLGAHSTVSTGYLAGALRNFRIRPYACVGGLTTAVGAPTWTGQAVSMALSSRFGVGNAKFRYMAETAEVDTVAFGLYPKELFARIGLFDERLVRNQDIEFNYRARREFGPILLDPSIGVTYFCRKDLGGLAQQAIQNGYWNVVTWRLVPNSLSWRHFVPLLFLVVLLSTSVLGVAGAVTSIGWRAWLPLIITFGTYSSCAVAVTAMWASRGQIGGSLILPLAFLVLHLSYGAGSLWAFVIGRREHGS